VAHPEGAAGPRASAKPGIRPTSDLIRGVIFDMLDAFGADYDRVLDLYAGTGALAIEALSRGRHRGSR
jgi:16S rRNA (guanine966-N2)-methyltransferase